MDALLSPVPPANLGSCCLSVELFARAKRRAGVQHCRFSRIFFRLLFNVKLHIV